MIDIYFCPPRRDLSVHHRNYSVAPLHYCFSLFQHAVLSRSFNLLLQLP
jgi:hypothetical protein